MKFRLNNDIKSIVITDGETEYTPDRIHLSVFKDSGRMSVNAQFYEENLPSEIKDVARKMDSFNPTLYAVVFDSYDENDIVEVNLER